MTDKNLDDFITRCIIEDVGDNDHTSLACIPPEARGRAKLLVKEEGIIAGIRIAKEVFRVVDNTLNCEVLISDGSKVFPGDIAFYVSGNQLSILKAERLTLNIMQRMSGIATTTRQYVNKLNGLKTKILDTRKTTPGMRFLEKEAVVIGGAMNHRYGLYDMIMIKDNHIDYAGGIEKTISRVRQYLTENKKNLKVVIEARTIDDVKKIMETGNVDRIMLDNFKTEDMVKAVKLINRQFETEASGGITIDNIRDIAMTGVDYISVGALTHHIKSLDLSLKAV